MADNLVTKQRENRKKKLLENSEGRLRKVMGLDKSTEKETEASKFQESLKNHCTNSQNHVHSHEDTRPQEASIFVNNLATHNSVSNIESQFHVQTDSKTNGTDDRQAALRCPSSIPTPIVELDYNVNKCQSEPTPTVSSTTRKKAAPTRTCNITTSTRLSLCAALATIMRLLIVMNISVVFETSVIAPFLMLELTFFIYDKLSQEVYLKPQTSGVLSAVLRFSGLSQTTIDWLITIMTLVSKTFDDFAVYFFTFCLLHFMLDDHLAAMDNA